MPRPRLQGLTPRRRRVLETIVRQWIATGEPVSSAAVRALSGLPDSPATLRNDLAALESMGLLAQPHRFSGRVPTPAGYRAFLEGLPRPVLRPADNAWLRSTLRRARDLQAAVAAAARAVASLTKLASIASLPITKRVEIESASLSRVSAEVALATFRLSTGQSGRVLCHLSTPADETRFAAWAEALSKVAGTAVYLLSPNEAPESLPTEVWRPLAEAMLAAAPVAEVTVEGTSHLLACPDLRASDTLSDLLALVGDRSRSYALLARGTRTADPQALIGLMGAGSALEACSMVIGFFGPKGNEAGRLAVLGPMRMDYERALAAVADTTAVLSDAWEREVAERD
ncbi:MAG: hypothetical protein N2512_15145 [Armatimonadetes bacterium]|nr:hypothetical protein [Armatimonadota bacterium]